MKNTKKLIFETFYDLIIGKEIIVEDKKSKKRIYGIVLFEGKNSIILLERRTGFLKFIIKNNYYFYIPIDEDKLLKIDGIYLNKRPYERLKQKIKGKYRL